MDAGKWIQKEGVQKIWTMCSKLRNQFNWGLHFDDKHDVHMSSNKFQDIGYSFDLAELIILYYPHVYSIQEEVGA